MVGGYLTHKEVEAIRKEFMDRFRAVIAFTGDPMPDSVYMDMLAGLERGFMTDYGTLWVIVGSATKVIGRKYLPPWVYTRFQEPGPYPDKRVNPYSGKYNSSIELPRHRAYVFEFWERIHIRLHTREEAAPYAHANRPRAAVV